jgi:hypothetical protein
MISGGTRADTGMREEITEKRTFSPGSGDFFINWSLKNN